MQLRPHQEKALEAMARTSKWQIIVHTGGGTTLIVIQDVIRQLDDIVETIFLVVPLILLAYLLCSEFFEEFEDRF